MVSGGCSDEGEHSLERNPLDRLWHRKAGGRIGAETVGLDVREISGPVFAELNAALPEHKAPVFRGRHLDDAGQLEFAARFGPLTGAHPTVPSVEARPQILQVNGDEGVRSNHWHTDVTFVRTRSSGFTRRRASAACSSEVSRGPSWACPTASRGRSSTRSSTT